MGLINTDSFGIRKGIKSFCFLNFIHEPTFEIDWNIVTFKQLNYELGVKSSSKEYFFQTTIKPI